MSIASKKPIYLDNAAATPVDERVQEAMIKASVLYGNPSSYNDIGRAAREAMDDARGRIARFLDAQREEIIFTSSGSESNSLAITGLVHDREPGTILSTPIEHPSVLENLKYLKRRGWLISFIKVDSQGFVDLIDLGKKLTKDVALVTIIFANNEIGSIQPVRKISELIKRKYGKKKPAFHVDACQAAGFLNMNVNNLGVDLLTFNGTKIYGPRGVGILYKRKNIVLTPIIRGGDQENRLRAGTENLPAIVGMAKATELIKGRNQKEMIGLRDYFISGLIKALPETKINGPLGEYRLASNINISIPGVSSENVLLELDKYGIYASGGSACTARSVEPSHVLKAIGLEKRFLSGALRFSLGYSTNKHEIDYVLKVLPKIVIDLRRRYKN